MPTGIIKLYITRSLSYRREYEENHDDSKKKSQCVHAKIAIKDASMTMPSLECAVNNVSVWHEYLGYPSSESLTKRPLYQ